MLPNMALLVIHVEFNFNVINHIKYIKQSNKILCLFFRNLTCGHLLKSVWKGKIKKRNNKCLASNNLKSVLYFLTLYQRTPLEQAHKSLASFFFILKILSLTMIFFLVPICRLGIALFFFFFVFFQNIFFPIIVKSMSKETIETFRCPQTEKGNFFFSLLFHLSRFWCCTILGPLVSLSNSLLFSLCYSLLAGTKFLWFLWSVHQALKSPSHCLYILVNIPKSN